MTATETATPEAKPDPTVEEELAAILGQNSGDRDAVRDLLLEETLGIVEYLRPVEDKNRRRIRLYLLLRELGVPIKDVADYLGVSEPSVRQALLKARRGRDGTKR